MPYSLALHLGLRYFRAPKGDQFVGLIAWFSLLGMVVGVAALVVVSSVMNGFEKELRDRVLGVVPHVFVEQQDGHIDDWQALEQRLLGLPHLLAAAPYIEGKAMATDDSSVAGLLLRGVNPKLQASVSKAAQHITSGSFAALNSQRYGIVIGQQTARRFGIGVDDSLMVLLPSVTVTPAGIFPRVKRFTVVGVFEVGAQIDGLQAFINIKDAAKLFRHRKGVQGIQLKLSDALYAGATAQAARELLGDGYRVKDWSDTQAGLFQAVKMEKLMVNVLLLVIVAVAAFNIVSVLTMMISDKRGNIAVLRTMGASSGQVMAVFMVQGMAIGIVGLVVGLLIGIPVAINVGSLPNSVETLFGVYMFDPSIYFISVLPSNLQWLDVAWISLVSLLLGLLSTIVPAWRASQIEPAEVLRYE